MTSERPARLRQSLEAKFAGLEKGGRLNAAQIRRRYVFQRLLRRLSTSGEWVLKGGFLLEVRISSGARATKDIDVATALSESLDDLTDRLLSVLEQDDDGDFLVFSISKVSVRAVDRQGLPSWSFTLNAAMAGRRFDTVKLDIAERLEEVAGGIELFVVPPVVPIEGLGAAELLAVDVIQHAAEKFHALSREFEDGRPNSRVKDLVDVMLMYEAGMIPHPRLKERLVWVFQHRDGTLPPADLPRYPRFWELNYNAIIADLELTHTNAADAHESARRLYREAISTSAPLKNEGNAQ